MSNSEKIRLEHTTIERLEALMRNKDDYNSIVRDLLDCNLRKAG